MASQNRTAAALACLAANFFLPTAFFAMQVFSDNQHRTMYQTSLFAAILGLTTDGSCSARLLQAAYVTLMIHVTTRRRASMYF